MNSLIVTGLIVALMGGGSYARNFRNATQNTEAKKGSCDVYETSYCNDACQGKCKSGEYCLSYNLNEDATLDTLTTPCGLDFVPGRKLFQCFKEEYSCTQNCVAGRECYLVKNLNCCKKCEKRCEEDGKCVGYNDMCPGEIPCPGGDCA